MNDKLGELKNMNAGGVAANDDIELGGAQQKVIQRNNYSNGNNNQDNEILDDNQGELFPEFTAKINKTKMILYRIQQNNEQIKEVKDQHLRAINGIQEKEANQELTRIMTENNKYNEQLKKNMEEMVKDVNKDKQENPDMAETAMKQKAFNALSAKVQEVLQESQNVQVAYKQEIKQKVNRQVKYLDADLTEQQIDEMVDDPQKYNDLLQEKTVGAPSIQLRNAVSDIQDKCRDIQKLQQNVELVHQMFLDMALLVQEQGQVIDNIELNIQGANKNFKQAQKNLEKAKEHHKEGRKKACCIILFGLVLIIAILMPILMSNN